LIIPLISKSPLSVSGPAAGLTSICSIAIVRLGLQPFFVAVALSGVLQIALGIFKLGGFTHLIPSAVIKGMLAAIGIILITKQLPLVIGYDQPNFWKGELFNVFTFRHGFDDLTGLWSKVSGSVLLISVATFLILIAWDKFLAKRVSFLPASFTAVIFGSLMAFVVREWMPALPLKSSHFVALPGDGVGQWIVPDFSSLLTNATLWETAILICIVASLESLLSIEAVDNLDPQHRVTPQSRELVAQGVGNLVSGMVGGIPVTSVIVRSSANVEAGARTSLSAFLHGVWLLLTVLLAASVVKYVPYCVLAVVLIRTGYSLAKPSMIVNVYRQGREQFLPFMVTLTAILVTDLLIGVLIGVGFAVYFLIRHTYRAGYKVGQRLEGHTQHVTIDLALNVSFLNKKRIMEFLEGIPSYSIVEVNGEHSVYIDHDVLEVLHDFKLKAASRHIQLIMKGVPEATRAAMH
jgi:carbonic anhydrase/SulP family sulfate permease